MGFLAAGGAVEGVEEESARGRLVDGIFGGFWKAIGAMRSWSC